MKTWILVANASEACLYTSKNLRKENLTLHKEFNHPESREKGMDLTADRAGHYSTNHSARGRFEDKSDPKKVEADNFARELVKCLQEGHCGNEYDKLVLVAAPHFYGLIYEHVKKHVKLSEDKCTHIAKDYTKLKPQALLEKLRKSLFELK